jgi:hypothetical protein
MTLSLLEKHSNGMLTDDQLAVESLNSLDPAEPGLALSDLPNHILRRVHRFATDGLHGNLVTNYGSLPKREQMLAATVWIEKVLHRRPNKTA